MAACCLACLTPAAHGAAPTPVDIAPDAEQVAIWPGLRIVANADRTLAPDQVARLIADNGAMRVDSPDRILGRAMIPHWAAFSLRNPGATELTRILSLEATVQFDVRLFERDENNAWRQVKSQAEAGAGRFGSGGNHPAWSLRLEPHRTADFLLRLEGPSLVRFPLSVHQPLSFAEGERRMHVAIGIALGSCLFICIYIGSLRRHLDDASVPLFICMMVADLIGALWLAGFLSELFPAVPESMLSPIGVAAYAVLFGCACMHARIYLNLAAWSPPIDRALQALGWLWLALAPWFGLAFPVGSRVLVVWGGTAIAIVLVYVSTLAARRNTPFSGFIAAAWLTYLIVGSIFVVARVGENPRLWSPIMIGLIQATAVAFLFGFAMIQRLMQQRDVLMKARQEALMQHDNAIALTRERSRLFAATSHDLRQPLVGVGLFANLLKSAQTSEEREEHTRKLDIAVREIDELLVGIQQLAAVHDASHEPVLETVGIDALLRPVVEEYRSRSEHKRITVRYVPSQLSVTTHVPYFQRIVRNALSNAIRYTEQGDRVLVGCRRADGLRLVIIDTGRGMTDEQTRLAFDPFQRFDTDPPVPDGFGLGLFSIKSLAGALGLEVRLRSKKGQGTTFSIRLLSTRQVAAS